MSTVFPQPLPYFFYIPSILLAFMIIELTTEVSLVISKSQRSCESGVNVQDTGHTLHVHSHVCYFAFNIK